MAAITYPEERIALVTDEVFDARPYQAQCMDTMNQAHLAPGVDTLADRLRDMADEVAPREWLLGPMIHAVAGLASEAGEIPEALLHDREKAVDEVGDAAWFLAELCTALGRDFREYEVAPESYRQESDVCVELSHAAGKLVGIVVQKAIFQGHPLADEATAAKIDQHMRTVAQSLSTLCSLLGTTFTDAQKRNIAKLRIRYQSGRFTVSESVNRPE